MKPFPALLLALGVGVFLCAPRLPAYQKPAHAPRPNFDKRPPAAAKAGAPDARRQAAVAQLRARVPGLRVDFDPLLGAPQIIASTDGFLSGPRGEGKAVFPERARAFAATDPHRAVKAFLHEHAALFGHGAEVLPPATLKRDYVTPHNGLRTVVWAQQLDGIPVFGSVLVGHVTRDGELAGMSSYFVPELERAAEAGTPNRAVLLAAPRRSAALAVVNAAASLDIVLPPDAVRPLDAAPVGPEQLQRFQAGDLPEEARAQLVWLPLDRATLRLCWQVELTRAEGGERYRVLVDAQSGEALLSRCLTVYLSDASYRVFTSDSPSPFSPGHPVPSTNQPPLVPRALVTLAALNANASPIGWISDGENETRGNNVDAHLDRNADNVPDLPRPRGAPFRVFDFPLDLNQSPAAYGEAAVVQLFYWCNWMHDRLYELGFTEAAGNFQKDNFGRGGRGGDLILADAQDGSGVNNANFTQTFDGVAPRIQMFVFNGPDPDRDGDFDAEIVLHEYTHGLSDRLVGGGVGLSTLQAAGMGEGWSDWYALALLSEPGDDVGGTYAVGAYATLQFNGLLDNYYFGIRRYPYSTDLAKNPLTFKDIDPAQASAHPGVPQNIAVGGGGAAEVHNQGEVWCVTLWELRANLIRKHGFSVGNQLALQLVTDGMKLSPPDPNFLQARDAILLADQVDTGGANFNELWAAFAKRGMGFSATSPASTTTFGVREAFDLPDALLVTGGATLAASGPAGGPFAPACGAFTLTNHTPQPLRWAVQATQPWLTVSPASGTLAGGAATNVTVCFNSAAGALPRGEFRDLVTFANLTSGYAQTRPVRLVVMGFTGLPFVEDFESGRLREFWTVTGTGPFRADVTTNLGPRGGAYHLILDSQANLNIARNEATLGLDLAGYSNVVLRFWTRSFDDEPHGPPPSPFLLGADFDGVAISEDGLTWHEVQGLRALSGMYAEFVVDLDAAIAARGLAYNRTFRIRFNQYDNYSVPLDGIALDDIAVTGVPARRFAVAVPAQAAEGDGVLRGQGSVSVGLAVPADRLVSLSSSATGRLAVPASVVIPAGATNAPFDLTIADNALLDGTEAVTITADAPGHAAGSATIAVFDNDRAALKVKLFPKAREGDSLLRKMGTVSVAFKPARPVVVQLYSSDPTEAQVPPTVVIPAGQHDASFDVTVVDDTELDGPQRATVTAHVENWTDGSDTVEIADNDVGLARVSVPVRASEGNGVLTNAGRVQLTATVPTNLVITLASSDATELGVPATVTVPAFQFTAPFDLTVLDDADVDGLQLVTVTPSAPGFGGIGAMIGILDDETPPVPYQPSPADGATQVAINADLAWYPGVGEIVVNGGFETGDFTGWRKYNGGFGDFVINNGQLDPEGPEGPSPPYAGKFSVVSQQAGGGGHTLFQDVLIPADAQSATLSWADRIRNYADRFVSPDQEFRVEIRDVKDTVLLTVFKTQPGDPLLNNWVVRSHDLTPFRGQVIRLAFVEQDNLNYFNVHLDNISVVLGDNGTTSYEVFFGTNPVPGAAEYRGTTTNAFWDLPPLALTTTYYWQVTSRRGAAATPGPVWRFTTRGVGGIASLEWSPIASPQFVNQPIPVTLTARDDIGNVATNFTGPVSLRPLSGTGTASAVLITEVDPGANDRVEFLNVSDRPLDLAGWTITIFDGRVWPGPRVTFKVPTNSLSFPGDVFLLSRLGTAPGAYPDFQTGTNIFWNNNGVSNAIAVLLRDAGGHVVDFFCAVDANPALITNPAAIPAAEWQGNPARLITEPTLTYQRVGNVDHNDASDWQANTNSVGSLNLGLSLPFQPLNPITITPTVAAPFLSGVWTGAVTVQQLTAAMRLLADDHDGQVALSAPFTVQASNDLAVTVTDQPDLLVAGDNVTYTVTVANSGPAPATDVRLTDSLPAGTELVSVAASQGGCASTLGGVVCDLGVLPGGAQAVATIVARTTAPGLITNTAIVTRAEADGHASNNTAQAVSTVNLAFIAVGDTSLNEGNAGTTNLMFPVRLSAPSPRPVSVDFATSDGLAVAGADYVATNGTLVFPPGVTSLSLPVIVLGDTLDEASETLFLNLTNPTNGVIVDAQAVGRINDNDPLPAFLITDATVVEGPAGTSTQAVFTVRLTTFSGLTTTVNFAVSNGTATALSDFEPQFGTLTFPPGATNQTIAVKVYGDRLFETNETFFVNLSTAVNAIIADQQGLGRILDDDAGELARFDVSRVPSPQYAGLPFAVTITARDGVNGVASQFNGAVALRGAPRGEERVIGSGTNVWEYPLGAGFHDSRLQVIYPAEELGRAGTISALALHVVALPGQVLTNWTIRLKHTPLTSYARPAWEGAGWTTVYRKDEAVTAAGWTTFFLDTPFAYNGTDSLMADFSFNNASYSSDGLCGAFPTSGPRAVFFQTDGAFGDPLDWSGTNAPPPQATNRAPIIRFTVGEAVTVTPPSAGPFTNGIWSGEVTVLTAVSNMFLRVADAEDHLGFSNDFAVEPGQDGNANGLPDAWEARYFGRLGAPGSEPGDDPDGDGLTNAAEFRARSDPTRPAGAVWFTSVAVAEADVVIRFVTVTGRQYRVERTDDVTSGRWTPVGDVLAGTGEEVEVRDAGAAGRPLRFYRVRIVR